MGLEPIPSVVLMFGAQRARRAAAAVAALLVLASVALAVGSSSTADRARIALGVNTTAFPSDPSRLDAFARQVGRRPAMVMWFQAFDEPLIDEDDLRAVTDRRAVPIVTWEPWHGAADDDAYSPLSIARGVHDRYLEESADAAAAWGRPLFVRFAHEMNGDWYPWGRVGEDPAARYVAAWKHVVGVFRRRGADNVRWIWSPNVDDGSRPFADFYPGDEFVDWVGLDGYNAGATTGEPWRGLEELFASSYDAITALTNRPLMIAETASAEAGGDKARWIREGLQKTLRDRMPAVRGIVWFDRDKEADWRVASSPRALEAFRAAVRQPAFDLPDAGDHLLSTAAVYPGLITIEGAARRSLVRSRNRAGP